MGRSRAPKPRGSRYVKPVFRCEDARQPERHRPDFVAELRAQSAPQRLTLEGLEHQTPPPALANLQYRCDRPGMTGFAGIPAFMKFAYGLGLADRLGDLPLPKRDSVYSPGKLCEVMVQLLAAGLERVSHVDDVTYDAGLCHAVGLPRLPDQATLSRLFSQATDRAVGYLRQVNHYFSRQTVEFEARLRRLVVDSDTRVVGVYGKQEGTVRSRRNGGKPHFTFEITTLRNTHDILDGGLLEGATHPVPLFEQRAATVLSQLADKTDELIWCADAAWYSARILQTIEASDADPRVPCACRYAIRAQISKRLLRQIAALPEEAWRPCGEGEQIAELRHAFADTRSGKDELARRYIVTRKALADKPAADGQAVLVPQPRYEYWAIVTNLIWAPRRVLGLYNDRATVETILKEGALGFHLDSLPSARFAGNELFCQLLILAYNHVNLFRRLCLPGSQSRHQVQGLRRLVLAIPGWIEDATSELVIHCASEGPHVQVLPCLLAALERWLSPAAPARAAPVPG